MTQQEALENFSHERDYFCPKCGVQMSSELVYKRLWRGSDKVNCASCEAKPQEQIRYGTEICTPWQGEFDEDDNPMKNGKLYRPGIRTCNHRDCVKKAHIITELAPEAIDPKTLLAEQHDISYRTGKRLTFDELMTSLKAERFAA